jgi:hypothetical protein
VSLAGRSEGRGTGFLHTFGHTEEGLHERVSSRRVDAMLPDEQATPEQLAIFRRMTPERRLALAEQLYWSARELKAAWLRVQHPDWTEELIAREVRRLFGHART